MTATIATLGNPNSGKTVLFNALTDSQQKVGNWNGVTVSAKRAVLALTNADCDLVDLPGIYDLAAQDSSADEQTTSSFLLQHSPDLILNIVDASHLMRSLYLTLQLRELGVPMVVVLNKMDVLKKERAEINSQMLSEYLGCPVIALSAHDKKALADFKTKISAWLQQPPPCKTFQCDYGTDFERAITQITEQLPSKTYSVRGEAIRYLEGQIHTRDTQDLNTLRAIRKQLAMTLDIELHVADVRYHLIHELIPDIMHHKGKLTQRVSERIDSIVLNRWLGIPVFMAMMYCMFMFAIQFGSAFIGFFDIIAGTFFVDLPTVGLEHMNAPPWLTSVLANGIGAGLQTVATFIPVIFALYLFLSFLERSGYLARAAFVVDAMMQKIGLPGKAFVPMLMGFGCTVPAVMATRTLANERERLLTSSMAPFMSCGARLPVYALFAVAFFPDSGQNLVFALYLIGMLAAVLTGFVLSKTLLPGESRSQPIEMPDYEIPQLRCIVTTAASKVKGFLLGAGKTIVLVVTVLGVLNTLGTDGRLGHEGKATSLLSTISKQVTPIFTPMGIREDNWQATVGIITGIFAKEALVGTLNSLYAYEDEPEESASIDLQERFTQAVTSVVDALRELTPGDPLGIILGDLHDHSALADDQELNESVYTNLPLYFDGQIGAFAYLLFILLYMPCAAAMGAMVREMGTKWAWGSALWCNAIAYITATLFYQIAHIYQHPIQTLAWLAFFSVLLLLIFFLLRYRGSLLPKDMVAQ